jgi:tetratricopeptide (TPR) repeat protein
VDENCVAQFIEVPIGSYEIKVSAPNILDSEPSSIELSGGMLEFEVQVRWRSNFIRLDRRPANSCISVTELGVPEKAKRELQRADEFIAKEKFDKAKDHLLKAIAMYPHYAGAYNNLAVVYAELGDRSQELECLQKAIRIDDRFSLAYLNLGRIEIAGADFPDAEITLRKAAISVTAMR